LNFFKENFNKKKSSIPDPREILKNQVVKRGTCVGCGSCVSIIGGKMNYTNDGVKPEFADGPINKDLSNLAIEACPGLGIHYPNLYREHYGSVPENWLLGKSINTRISYSNNEKIRGVSASGGVITQTLVYLLERGYVDAVILVKQGLKIPERAEYFIAKNKEEIISCSQSVYVPVSMLDALTCLEKDKKYAITCLPEQAASLRVMQSKNFPPALQIKYILGPYTGTSILPSSIRALLKSNGIKDNDQIISLKWRAGDWPGYLEVRLSSGEVVRSKKVYYNFLIPFYITNTSLQSIDFYNEFSDLSVGDAWSPKYEKIGKGFSVVTTRSTEIEDILKEMIDKKLISSEPIDKFKASEMHGHMLDFKKRGSHIRNRWRTLLGKSAPNNGILVNHIGFKRYLVELLISIVFIICRTRLSRAILTFFPENIIGPFFNALRLSWKNMTKPTKRKGLANLDISEVNKEK